jgi:hypothetical protein
VGTKKAGSGAGGLSASHLNSISCWNRPSGLRAGWMRAMLVQPFTHQSVI